METNTIVYAVIATQISFGDVQEPIINLFQHKKDAIKHFNNVAYGEDGERKYAIEQGWIIGCEDETYFEAYEDGRFNQNSTCVMLQEKILN